MKDRINQIIENQRLTSSRFADIINVQRSSVSHVLSGRNKPSLDFLQKILMAFPDINGDWLLTGIGPMTRSGEMSSTVSDQSSMKESMSLFNMDESKPKVKPMVAKPHKNITQINTGPTESTSPRIKKIVVIYDDYTIDEFTMSKRIT